MATMERETNLEALIQMYKAGATDWEVMRAAEAMLPKVHTQLNEILYLAMDALAFSGCRISAPTS